MQVVHTLYHKWQAIYGQLGIEVPIICLPAMPILDVFSLRIELLQYYVPRFLTSRSSTACNNAHTQLYTATRSL